MVDIFCESRRIAIVILMGVSGSGKTTIGKKLATAIGWEFFDADSFHSSEATKKMARGQSLTDEDRAPWLQQMQNAIGQWRREERNVILACSALKAKYRQILQTDSPEVQLVYLKGSYELLHERLMSRKGHFMKADLLQSQLDTLEEPKSDEAIIIDIEKSISAIVQEIQGYLTPKLPEK